MMRNRAMKRAVLVTAAVMLLLVPVLGHADTESPALAKYRGRVDLAVKKALAFIATRQKPDGSFDDRWNTNASVGLAGMAYLSVGHTPGRGPYGDVVNRCIDFILATPAQGPHGGAAKGYLGRATPYGRMYSHAIATLFLCEVSGMVDPERRKKIDALLPKALKLILTAQARQKEARLAGGWRYSPHDSSSDLSISGWCLTSSPRLTIAETTARYTYSVRSDHSCGTSMASPTLRRTDTPQNHWQTRQPLLRESRTAGGRRAHACVVLPEPTWSHEATSCFSAR